MATGDALELEEFQKTIVTLHSCFGLKLAAIPPRSSFESYCSLAVGSQKSFRNHAWANGSWSTSL